MMKIRLHKKIAAYFGYEFTKIVRNNSGRLVEALINKHDIDLVIDVGANMGQFATGLRQMGYAGRIISFEPVNACYQHISAIADEQWQVENYALGDANKTENIHISINSDLSSILSASDYGKFYYSGKIDTVGSQRTQIKKLDEVIPELVNDIDKRKVFLKLDRRAMIIRSFMARQIHYGMWRFCKRKRPPKRYIKIPRPFMRH